MVGIDDLRLKLLNLLNDFDYYPVVTQIHIANSLGGLLNSFDTVDKEKTANIKAMRMAKQYQEASLSKAKKYIDAAHKRYEGLVSGSAEEVMIVGYLSDAEHETLEQYPVLSAMIQTERRNFQNIRIVEFEKLFKEIAELESYEKEI